MKPDEFTPPMKAYIADPKKPCGNIDAHVTGLNAPIIPVTQ